jgi:two-component system, chemotaxis family, sensor kinase CheA
MDQNKKISDALLGEFISECEEITGRVSQNLSAFEKNEFSPEMLDSLYRDMHTFKGSSQLLGFKELGELAHAMETSLDPIRRNKRAPSARLLEALFHCLDLIDKIVKAIQTNASYNMTNELERAIPALIDASLDSFGKDFDIKRENVSVNEDLSLKEEVIIQVKPEPKLSPPEVVSPMAQTHEENLEHSHNDAVSTAAPEKSERDEHASGAGEKANADKAAAADATNTIRVPVSLLDKLMALMGEMVLVRNQVLQYSNNSDDLEFLALSQRLDLVTSELQGEVMKTRMQPIGNVLTKFQRVVRDLARDLNKKLELNLYGVETELDKTLLEAIKDPLTHIVRNSCDHGIETPEERRKSGKPEMGHVAIRSFHEGGQVIVEISDDGKGLHRDKLLAKALEKGVIGQDKVGQMTDRDIMNLIFAPGFSTAAKVTNVSGRGVGMDVVKNNIEKIGGQAEVESIAGKGMTVRLKIPLTLAIVPAMLIKTANARYAIPQVKLVELLRVDNAEKNNQIEFLQGKPMYRLRGELLPLVNLKEIFGLETPGHNGLNEATNIVVLKSERQMFGLIVDEIQDTADIVVKPLSQFLKSLSLYSGATVLGDGSVALILDVIGLSQIAHLSSERGAAAVDNAVGATKGTGNISSDAQEMLLFRIAANSKYAIPLNLVQRLEEFKANEVEFSGEQRVMRYRGSILPIISLNQFFGFKPKASIGTEVKDDKQLLSVIVVQKSGRPYGVEVDDILDVASIDGNIDDSLKDRVGIHGNMIYNNEVVVVVDLLRVVEQEAKRMLNRSGAVEETKYDKDITDFNDRRKSVKILFAEDTAFFRKHVKSVLDRAGYTVTCVNDGQEAFKRLELAKEGDFDLLLSDIEMPKMTGLELAQAVRREPKWKEIPLIALTTRFSEHHSKEGKKAGFNSYLEKMKPEELVTEIDKILKEKGGTL